MDKRLPDDPILARLKRELEALYGPRLKQVLLYGSRARGDFREDSDYDVLVVLEGPLDWWAEQKKLSPLSDQILWDTVGIGRPAVISFKPVTPDDLQKRTGFMHNVRNEAIAL
jgi:predicted nucleotidyltransferase